MGAELDWAGLCGQLTFIVVTTLGGTDIRKFGTTKRQ